MRTVSLASEIDFAGWRAAARRLRAERIPPSEVIWTTGDPSLFNGCGETDAALDPDRAYPGPKAAEAGFNVPRDFVELASKAVLNREPGRFDLLYRLLWRLQAEPKLMQVASDPDVAALRSLARAVGTAYHKMQAFVRFRQIFDDAGELYAAWFEPPHRVTEAVAPFFVQRFASMRFSLLTPDACALWDRQTLRFTPGVDRDSAPPEDALEAFWRTYYASIFNPARLKVAAMEKEMPRRYWRNLPEARLIPELIASAETRAAAMVQSAPTQPSARARRTAERHARDGAFNMDLPGSLEEVVAGVDACRRCDLWKHATQGVAGEGPPHAKLLFVGEQPGDQEDLAGRPFVGPAGGVFDKALAEARVPRAETYVTNAVKHFKHELRGKRRLHKTPNSGEIDACRWWLDAERRLIRPRVIVALGASAAFSVFGKATPIAANRGKAIQLPDQAQGVVTYHPSFLLRLPDPEAKAQAYAAFVQDLKFAWSLAG
jgi:DNA polymerase